MKQIKQGINQFKKHKGRVSKTKQEKDKSIQPENQQKKRSEKDSLSTTRKNSKNQKSPQLNKAKTCKQIREKSKTSRALYSQDRQSKLNNSKKDQSEDIKTYDPRQGRKKVKKNDEALDRPVKTYSINKQDQILSQNIRTWSKIRLKSQEPLQLKKQDLQKMQTSAWICHEIISQIRKQLPKQDKKESIPKNQRVQFRPLNERIIQRLSQKFKSKQQIKLVQYHLKPFIQGLEIKQLVGPLSQFLKSDIIDNNVFYAQRITDSQNQFTKKVVFFPTQLVTKQVFKRLIQPNPKKVLASGQYGIAKTLSCVLYQQLSDPIIKYLFYSRILEQQIPQHLRELQKYPKLFYLTIKEELGANNFSTSLQLQLKRVFPKQIVASEVQDNIKKIFAQYRISAHICFDQINRMYSKARDINDKISNFKKQQTQSLLPLIEQQKQIYKLRSVIRVCQQKFNYVTFLSSINIERSLLKDFNPTNSANIELQILQFKYWSLFKKERTWQEMAACFVFYYGQVFKDPKLAEDWHKPKFLDNRSNQQVEVDRLNIQKRMQLRNYLMVKFRQDYQNLLLTNYFMHLQFRHYFKQIIQSQADQQQQNKQKSIWQIFNKLLSRTVQRCKSFIVDKIRQLNASLYPDQENNLYKIAIDELRSRIYQQKSKDISISKKNKNRVGKKSIQNQPQSQQINRNNKSNTKTWAQQCDQFKLKLSKNQINKLQQKGFDRNLFRIDKESQQLTTTIPARIAYYLMLQIFLKLKLSPSMLLYCFDILSEFQKGKKFEELLINYWPLCQEKQSSISFKYLYQSWLPFHNKIFQFKTLPNSKKQSPKQSFLQTIKEKLDIIYDQRFNYMFKPKNDKDNSKSIDFIITNSDQEKIYIHVCDPTISIDIVRETKRKFIKILKAYLQFFSSSHQKSWKVQNTEKKIQLSYNVIANFQDKDIMAVRNFLVSKINHKTTFDQKNISFLKQYQVRKKSNLFYEVRFSILDKGLDFYLRMHKISDINVKCDDNQKQINSFKKIIDKIIQKNMKNK